MKDSNGDIIEFAAPDSRESNEYYQVYYPGEAQGTSLHKDSFTFDEHTVSYYDGNIDVFINMKEFKDFHCVGTDCYKIHFVNDCSSIAPLESKTAYDSFISAYADYLAKQELLG